MTGPWGVGVGRWVGHSSYRLLRRYFFLLFFFSWWGLGRQRLLDLSMWELISTLWPCPSAGSRGASNRGSRRHRPQSRTSGWIPQSHSAWRQWWATGRYGECWSPSPSLNSPASAADTKGQTTFTVAKPQGEPITRTEPNTGVFHCLCVSRVY